MTRDSLSALPIQSILQFAEPCVWDAAESLLMPIWKDKTAMSKLAFWAQRIRPSLLPFLTAFLTTVCLLEAFCQLSAERRFSGDWDVRFRKEAAAVEMYGEDIWLHGHRTLKTPFDPRSCEITPHKKWHVYWANVQCTAEDQLGRKWQYTARYSNTTTPMFGIPFLVDDGPLREMKVIPSKTPTKETGK